MRPETCNSHAVACREGNLVLLKELAERSVGGARSRDNRGWTPLHEAAYSGHVDCIRFLSTLPGVDLNSRTWEGETPLFLAVKNLPHSKQAVHALLKLRAKVKLGTNEGCTPLQYAAVKGDLEVVTWLVRRGANVNQENVWRETPLHCALKRSNVDEDRRLGILKYLVKHGAKVNVCDENELTPLMLAAQKGLLEVCGFLLEQEQSLLNMRAEDGATAIMLACQAGRVEVVRLLLEAGAELDHAAQDGTMAVHLAAIAKQNCNEILKMILPGTNINKVYARNQVSDWGSPLLEKDREKGEKILSPFHLAIDWENYSALEVLVQYLDPTRFYIAIDECPVHGEYCTNFQQGRCALFRYRVKNPLAHLLSCPTLPNDTDKLLDILESNIVDKVSLPPLLSLLTGCRRVDGSLFIEGDLHRTVLRRLLMKGATFEDYFPLILLSPVSGLYALLQEGVISPLALIDMQILDNIRQLLNQGFSRGLLNTQFSVPLLSPRLLAVAHLVSECGMMNRHYLSSLHDVLWFQLTELQIPKVDILTELYTQLREPRSLQALCRRSFHSSITGVPRDTVAGLKVPTQLASYLLFSDVDISKIFSAYQKTWDLIHSVVSRV